jgi:hypothetical protein
MNCGANVPIGVLLRAEFDRSRDESLRPRGLLSCVRDWFRACAIFGSVSARGEEMRPDFGRAVFAGPGDGEFVGLRVNGEGRACELREVAKPRPFGADMVVKMSRRLRWFGVTGSCSYDITECRSDEQPNLQNLKMQIRICTRMHHAAPKQRQRPEWYA